MPAEAVQVAQSTTELLAADADARGLSAPAGCLLSRSLAWVHGPSESGNLTGGSVTVVVRRGMRQLSTSADLQAYVMESLRNT